MAPAGPVGPSQQRPSPGEGACLLSPRAGGGGRKQNFKAGSPFVPPSWLHPYAQAAFQNQRGPARSRPGTTGSGYSLVALGGVEGLGRAIPALPPPPTLEPPPGPGEGEEGEKDRACSAEDGGGGGVCVVSSQWGRGLWLCAWA